MKCSRVKDDLSRYVEGALPGDEQAAVARHLAACPACRAEAEAFRRAEEALRSLAAVMPAPDLTADLRRRLSAAGPAPRPLRWVWADAAVAVVAAAAALLALRAPAPPAPPKTAAREPVAAKSHPRQFAVQPVTEEAGVPRPTAPPHPSPASPDGKSTGHRGSARGADRSRYSRLLARRSVPEADGGGSGLATRTATSDDGRYSRISNLDSRPSLVPDGVVLLVAAPQPLRPSSSYCGEVTLPDGATSTYQETVERDAAGEQQSVKIVYQQTPPQAGVGNGG